jgi:hypothetical protein
LKAAKPRETGVLLFLLAFWRGVLGMMRCGGGFLLLKDGEMRGKDGGWARNFPEAKILQVF